MNKARIFFQRLLHQCLRDAQNLIELLILFLQRMSFTQRKQANSMDMQITCRLAALDQMLINGGAYIINIGSTHLTLQMFAAPPHKLNRVMFRSQRERLQIKACRACSGQHRSEKCWFSFRYKAEERGTKRKQVKQIRECGMQGGRVPRPVITTTTQCNLEWFHSRASP